MKQRTAMAGNWKIAALTLWMAGCAGEATSGPATSGSEGGSALPEHAGSALVDPHQGGGAQVLALAEVGYGRLVDLYDREAPGGEERLQHVDLVVDPELAGDAVDYLFESAADRTRLVVLHPAGSPAFGAALARASGELPALVEGAVVPRDAVLSLCFDDLLDPQRIPPGSISVAFEGAPLAVRVLPDPNHGGFADLDGDGSPEFYPSRVIVDPVASRLAQLRGGEGGGSSAGWPGPALAGCAQLELTVSAGSRGAPFEGVRGARLAASGDVSRIFGSGPSFLAASGRPRVLGEQQIDVLRIQPLGGQRFAASYQFEVDACRALPARGDLIEFAGATAEVLGGHPSVDPATGVISGVPLYLLAGSAAALVPGDASYVAPFDAASDVPECFVTFSIPPGAPPATGISSDTAIEVRFSQPMDPASVEALQSFALERDWPVPALEEKVVGAILAAPDGRRFTLVPSLPLATDAPTSPAAYVFDLDGSPAGVVAADGTPLAQDLPPVRFELDPSQPPQSNSGIVLEFDVQDEDGNGSPELRGQFLFDFLEEQIQARPVQRFSAAADPSQTTTPVSIMTPIGGVTTPLVPLGSKLMSVWRYCDLGFLLLDETFHNIDVEGLYWSPDPGQPLAADQFTEFQMSLGHAGFLPDEGLNTGLLPVHPASGLQGTFDQNYLDPTQPQVVHPKASGYTIDPLDLTAGASGLPLMPWPMNRGIPISQYSYWTFRDTAIQSVGGPNGEGADPLVLVQVMGAAMTYRGFYPEDEVPTIGLPLLTEFRTYPDPAAQGSNALQVAIAINSSAMPYFRAYSSGGISSSGASLTVDPDQEPVASGALGGGVFAMPLDNVFYYGQADFVVRVSRAHTVWFDTQGALAFGPAVLEPVALHQPPGTSVALAFRGATGIASQVPQVWATTKWIGPYGDSFTFSQILKLNGNPNESFTVTFLNGDPTWKSQLADLDGAQYVQARISMIANSETGAIPTVSGLGLPFAK